MKIRTECLRSGLAQSVSNSHTSRVSHLASVSAERGGESQRRLVRRECPPPHGSTTRYTSLRFILRRRSSHVQNGSSRLATQVRTHTSLRHQEAFRVIK